MCNRRGTTRLLDEAEASAPAVGEVQAAPVAEPPAAVGGREPSSAPPERAAGAVTTVRVESPDLDSVVRVVLLWEAPVDLDLAVVEPGGRIGSGRGVVGDPAGGTGRGVIERRDGGRSAGHALESYRVPRAAFAETGAALAVYVVDATGGRLAAPLDCGEGARSRVDYRILVRIGSEVRERRFRLPAPACGAAPGGDAIYRRALTVAVPPAPVLFPQ